MRARSPVASSQVAARASRPTRAWRDCPHTRVETRRRQACSNGGNQIAYEPLQESGELFGVLKCKPLDSEAESPEFSHLGRRSCAPRTQQPFPAPAGLRHRSRKVEVLSHTDFGRSRPAV